MPAGHNVGDVSRLTDDFGTCVDAKSDFGNVPTKEGRLLVDAFKVYARWLLLAPAAIGGAYLAYFVSGILSRFFLIAAGFDKDSFVSLVYLEAQSGMVLGAAFVYVGIRVAPTQKMATSIGLAVIGLLATGALAAIATMDLNYLTLWSCGWVVFGIVIVTYGMFRGEVT